jgi:hypothetical protein
MGLMRRKLLVNFNREGLRPTINEDVVDPKLLLGVHFIVPFCISIRISPGFYYPMAPKFTMSMQKDGRQHSISLATQSRLSIPPHAMSTSRSYQQPPLPGSTPKTAKDGLACIELRHMAMLMTS